MDACADLVAGRPGLLVVIPAFNEERFIGSVVLRARRMVSQVIVVDDGSTDATAQIAADAGAVVVKHRQNQGKGAALNTGFDHARHLDPAAAVVTIDADGQHVAEQISRVAAPVLKGEADIVVGSRYLDRSSAVPRRRVLGHRLFNVLTGQAAGVNSSDSQSGFRAFSPRALSCIRFRSGGFSVESEMQFLAHEHQLKLVEVAITILYPDRPKRSLLAHGLMVMNGILRLVGQYRPLLFFGVPGAVLLLAGLAWGAWVVDIYRRQTVLAVGYTLISMLLTILGSATLFTGIMLHSMRGLLVDLLHERAAQDRVER